MKVTAPDGTVIDNVPDDWTQEDLAEALPGQYGFPDAPQTVNYHQALRENLTTGLDPAAMLKNTPGSAAKMAGDMAHAVMNPIDTASTVWNVAKGFGDKAGINFNKKSEEMYADAVLDMINERYGSMDKFYHTMNTDPVGAMADIAGTFTMGSGALAKMAAKSPKIAAAAKKAQQLSAAADPVNLAMNTAKAGIGKATKAGLPTRWYEEVVKFSNAKYTPAQREKLYKTALDNKIEPTPKGVDKLNTLIGALGDQIDEIIDAADSADTQIPVSVVRNKLEALKGDKGGFKFDAQSDLGAIDDALTQFDALVGDNKTVSAGELQAFKRDRYDHINFNAQRQTGTPIGEDINKALAAGAREGLEAVDPRVRGINRDMGDLLELQKPLEKAAGRIGNRNAIGIQTPLVMAGLGQAGGADAAAVGGVLSFIFNPQNKAKLAIGLHHLKTGNPAWLQNNLTATEARYVLMLSGRADEELREMGLLVDAEKPVE